MSTNSKYKTKKFIENLEEIEDYTVDLTKENKKVINIMELKDMVHDLHIDLVKGKHKKYRITKQGGSRYITLFINTIKELVEAGNTVEIKDFITLERKLRNPKPCYSPKLGKMVVVPTRFQIEAKVSAIWKRRSRILLNDGRWDNGKISRNKN